VSPRFIIVAHSFGTHLAAFALRGIPSDKLPNVQCIILAGSVLKSDFDWSPLFRSGRVKQVVNDCGSGDWVLALSQIGVPFTGMAGCIGFFGFDGSTLINRVFPGGHSHYFGRTADDPAPFMRKHWLPLLLGQSPSLGPERTIPNWLGSVYYTVVQVDIRPRLA
jgi:hypothetical protein